MSSTEQKVIDIIVEQLGVDRDEVTRDKKLVEDFNADSLDLTELNMTFEERLGKEIPSDEAEKFKTVGNIIDYFERMSKE
ncbi:MAG: acyl carrier protein [Parachlamydiaceae bacterium]|nr:MAG: acyl carrier protein [Parachlamydiaceae bacterium]